MIRIYVGGTEEYLAQKAMNEDVDASLVLPTTPCDLIDGTYYASLGDFGARYDLFYNFLCQADVIVYSPSLDWSSRDPIKIETEKMLESISTRIPVLNFSFSLDPIPNFITKVSDQRKSTSNQLWVAGCSISEGIGVAARERYGHLLAEKLDRPVSFLAQRGTSILWASNQIYKAYLKPGDTLIWGLTSTQRFFQFSESGVNHIGPGWRIAPQKVAHLKAPQFDVSRVDLDRIGDIDTIYQCVNSIVNVERYCEINKIKLILADLFADNLIKWFGDRHHYISLTLSHLAQGRLYLDLGDDNEHPGPLTHQWYADCLLKKYFNLGEDRA